MPLRHTESYVRELVPQQSSDHWARRIAILNDYVRVPYANGSSFASQMLYREFGRRGHEVTVVGPADPKARGAELPRRHIELPSLPLRNHPGVYLPFPHPRALESVRRARFDITIGQTGSALMNLGVWLRAKHRVPLLCVNTIHLPSVYNVLLPDGINRSPLVNRAMQDGVVPWLERHSARIYNQSDGLVVLSSGLKRYWRECGVTVPIFVIRRAVEPRLFSVEAERDPFPGSARRGARLLVVCRHTREKGLEHLLRMFAELIAPAAPDATLTLVGDGPDSAYFKQLAAELGVGRRTHFAGEQSVRDVPAWYRHADVFVYTSLSETYGQVVSEALWCGLPVVALADGMGVSDQIDDGKDGALIEPGPTQGGSDWRFANAVLGLLRSPALREEYSSHARSQARQHCDPDRILQRYYGAFDEARAHCVRTQASDARASGPSGLLRWTAVHGLLAGLGCVRRPPVNDIEHAVHPSWEDRLEGPERRMRPAVAGPRLESA